MRFPISRSATRVSTCRTRGTISDARRRAVLPWLKPRLRQGFGTIRFPDGADFPERFRGRPQGSSDLGACLFSPEEGRYSRDYRMATSTRDALVTATGEVELARALDQRVQKLFRRSLRLRSVAAGSCNGCEAELIALGNVVFDLARFGVQFVASPRHADGIVVTGAVNRHMRRALELTYEAIPSPNLAIAVGACAISGGPFAGRPEAVTAAALIPPVTL